MLIALIVVFIALTLLIGGDKTAKSLVTLSFNAVFSLCVVFLIAKGFHPIVVTVIACIIISLITLFYQNEINDKTVLSFLSVLIVIAIMFALLYQLTMVSGIQGFPVGQLDIRDSNGYSRNIDRNMMYIQISVILMVFIGAVIDTALAVASALYEVHLNNPHLSGPQLFSAGIGIGRDILSSTINTLFYIYLAEYLTLFVYFASRYSFAQMINSKEFAQEFLSIALSGVGCIIIIPVAAALGAWRYKTGHPITEKSSM